MKLSSPIIFLATADPQRARTFYEQVLGLEFLRDEPFALVFKTGDSDLRIAKVQRVHAPPYTVLGWTVLDIRAAAAALRAAGVTFQRYPDMPQDVDGIWQSPSGALIAWFRDPEGHVLSLTQPASPPH